MVTRPRNLPQADPDFDSVVLLVPFSGEDGDTTTSDLSNSAHTSFTWNGTSALDGDIRRYGFTSLQLDGDSDYVEVPHSADWAFGTGDFTIECDVRFNALPNTDGSGMCMLAHYLNTGNDRSWFFNFETNDELKFWWSVDGTNLQILESTTTPALSTNTWYHVAACRDGNNIRLFFDGSEIGSSTAITGDDLHDSARPLDIGRLNSAGFSSRFVDGWIENVRITKGVARYTAAFTPPERAHPTVKEVSTSVVGSSLVLHLDASNTASYPGTGSTWSDLTDNNLDFTYDVGGTPTFDSDGGGSFDFAGGDAVNDVFDIATNSLLEPGEIWSICWWSKHAVGSTSTQQYIYSHLSNRLAIIAGYQSGNVNAFINATYPGGSSNTQMPFTEDEWTFFCYTKGPNIDSNNWKGYKNATEQFSLTQSFTVGDQNGSTHIGNTGTNAAQFQGKTGFWLFYDRALTADEVTLNYNATKSRFGL